MSADTQNEHGDLPLEWVEKQLRSLAAVNPPESLKDRLTADVAQVAVAGPKYRYFWLWPRRMRWASAAAAVILVASVVGWLGFLPGPQVQPAPNSPDSVGWASAADHNSLQALDTNSCDTNSLR